MTSRGRHHLVAETVRGDADMRPYLLLGFLLTFAIAACSERVTGPSQALEGQREVPIGKLERSAKEGDAQSQFELATQYDFGSDGVRKDPDKAVTWYRKAAEQNHPSALHNLGTMYRDGIGVPVDVETAAYLLGRAAEQGHPAAMHSLGWMFFEGTGVEKDESAAMALWRRAAQTGNANAMNAMGHALLYRKREKVEALAWFRLAAKYGDRLAPQNATNLQQRLTPDEIAAADKAQAQIEATFALK